MYNVHLTFVCKSFIRPFPKSNNVKFLNLIESAQYDTALAQYDTALASARRDPLRKN